jgi:FkbM family methyltransferase
MNKLSKPDLTVIDIGARGGIQNEWHRIGKAVKLICFEPDERLCEEMNEKTKNSEIKQEYYPYAIAGKRGKRDFFVTRRKTVSSLYRPIEREWKKYAVPGSERNRRAEVDKTVRVEAVTLEDFCRKNNLKPDFLKIDTQGSELEIIRDGFDSGISSLLGIEIEVEFVHLYHGQPLFSETELYLRSKGFAFVGMKRHIWKMNDGENVDANKGGRMVFADALFFKDELIGKKTSKEKALKTALMAHRYNLHDIRNLVLKVNDMSRFQFEDLIESVYVDNTISMQELFNKVRRIISYRFGLSRKIVGFDEIYGI